MADQQLNKASNEDDDIYARLESALLKDLINLKSLEMALDEHERNAETMSNLSPSSLLLPRDLTSLPLSSSSSGKPTTSKDFVVNSSAASFVVSHQAQRQAQDFLSSGSSSGGNYGATTSTTNTILNFDTLAAHEFLMADSAKKSKQQQQQRLTPTIQKNPSTSVMRAASNDSEDGVDTAAAKNLVNSLLFDDEEEYNIHEEPLKFSTTTTNSSPPIITSVAETAAAAAAAVTTTDDGTEDAQKAAKSLLAMLQQRKPEPQQQQQQQQFLKPGGTGPISHPPLPPHMDVDNRNDSAVVPLVTPAAVPTMHFIPQQIPMHPLPMPPPTTLATAILPHPLQQPQHFPPLGSQSLATAENNTTNIALPLHKPRILFNNPHVTRVPPIRADLVASSLMPPRDILYVVHAMIRPLVPLIENPYDNDYYFQIFTERQGMSPAEKPAWKDEKKQIVGKELHFRQVVVERAKDWKEDKQTLGHIVKTDIKRPRALLAVPVLSKMGLVDEAISSNEESSQRAQLWRSRVLVDKGYQAHLELVEAQRLLTTNVTQERVQELMQDIESNIVLLHSYFGLTITSGKDPVVDVSSLRACLNLTKGQELVARCMEERSLPHASACILLPYIICTIFADARPTTMTEVAVAKEDRLCRSLRALVLLRNPAVSKEILLQCLEGMVEIAASANLKKVLGYAARAGVMHAVLSRGGEMFTQSNDVSQDLKERWRLKEMEFKNLLSSSS